MAEAGPLAQSLKHDARAARLHPAVGVCRAIVARPATVDVESEILDSPPG